MNDDSRDDIDEYVRKKGNIVYYSERKKTQYTPRMQKSTKHIKYNIAFLGKNKIAESESND